MINSYQSLGGFNMTPAWSYSLQRVGSSHMAEISSFVGVSEGMGVRKEVGAQHTKGESFYTTVLVAFSFGVLFWASHTEFLDFSVVTTIE